MTSSKDRSSKSDFGAKVAFVLAQPADRPASEIVAEAKQAGLSFAPGYVYTVRLRAKRAASQPPKRRGRKPKAPTHPSTTATTPAAAKTVRARRAAPRSSRDPEARFAAMLLELGFVRAEAVLRSVRELLSSIEA